MEPPDKSRDPATALDTLRALLDAAGNMAAELARKVDPFVGRLTKLFERMPAEDRGPMLDVLEREVELRVLSRTKGDADVGLGIGRPDPNARLYVRIWEPARIFQNHDDLLRAVLRGIQLVLRTPVRVQEDWNRATAEAFRTLDAVERGALIRHLRQWLAVAERLEQGASARAS